MKHINVRQPLQKGRNEFILPGAFRFSFLIVSSKMFARHFKTITHKILPIYLSNLNFFFHLPF